MKHRISRRAFLAAIGEGRAAAHRCDRFGRTPAQRWRYVAHLSDPGRAEHMDQPVLADVAARAEPDAVSRDEAGSGIGAQAVDIVADGLGEIG